MECYHKLHLPKHCGVDNTKQTVIYRLLAPDQLNKEQEQTAKPEYITIKHTHKQKHTNKTKNPT